MDNENCITELTMEDVLKTIERASRPYHVEYDIIIPAAGMEEYKKLSDETKENSREAQHQMLKKGFACFVDEQIIYEEDGE